MDLLNCKHLRSFGRQLSSVTCKCLALVALSLITRAVLLSTFSEFGGFELKNIVLIDNPSLSLDSKFGIRGDKFLEVPQIVWGLNNQKIAVARALLTARMLNRTLLMPSLCASLFYKEIDQLQPISFNKMCFEFQKGSGRKWTVERDLVQLRQFSMDPYDGHEVIRVTGKNPFLWHDHWSVNDYAKVFECLVLVDTIAKEADNVITKIGEVGRQIRSKIETLQNKSDAGSSSLQPVPYVAVHMRIEEDWMIHCKKLEQRSNISQICSSKEEIMDRMGNIAGLNPPTAIYLAVADSLLEDNTVLNGWKNGLLPFEKKKLGVDGIYKKYPYLIQSAIDYEVCMRADVFVGNNFSTFSSLVVLERTQKMIKMGVTRFCSMQVRWPYAYNILGELNGPQRWITNMSDSSLQAISYGSTKISC